MRFTGKVLEVRGSVALVESKKNEACASCESKCSGCIADSVYSAYIDNTLGAKAGDKVLLEKNDATSFMVSFFIFLLPLILSAALYFLLLYFSENNNLSAIICSVVFVISFFVSTVVTNKKIRKNNPVKMVEILIK